MEVVTGLEQLVLLSAYRQHPDAYGVSIKAELLGITTHDYSIGAIYGVLDRLERKGLVKARKGPPEEKRGGRGKLFYELTVGGLHTLRTSLQVLDRLRDGLDLEGVPA